MREDISVLIIAVIRHHDACRRYQPLMLKTRCERRDTSLRRCWMRRCGSTRHGDASSYAEPGMSRASTIPWRSVASRKISLTPPTRRREWRSARCHRVLPQSAASASRQSSRRILCSHTRSIVACHAVAMQPLIAIEIIALEQDDAFSRATLRREKIISAQCDAKSFYNNGRRLREDHRIKIPQPYRYITRLFIAMATTVFRL